MENETMQVERLNRGRPPPGYILEVIDNEWWWGEGQGWLDGTSYLDHDAALRAAWAHYQARHDPPGMRIAWEPDDRCKPDGEGEWHVEVDDANGRAVIVAFEVVPRRDAGIWSRPAIWAWYWRRVEGWRRANDIVHRALPPLAADVAMMVLWPDMLAWPDDKMSKHEAELDAAERKREEVLRG